MVSVDCRNGQSAEAEKLAEWLDFAAANPCTVTLYFLPIVPAPDHTPEGITSLAEREYDYHLAHAATTPAEQFYLELEALCRRAVRDAGARVNLLRYVNVYGPEVDGIEDFSFADFIRECAASGTVSVGP